MTDFVSKALNEAGFVVHVANGAVEGLTRFRDLAAEVNLVLLDMKMPKMYGDEVYRQLRTIDPSIGVILSSGYVEAPKQVAPDFKGNSIV